MGLVTVLYVFVKVSLFLPQWVEVRAFSILIVFSALSFEVLICSLNVSLGSKVSPSILGLRIVGSRVLSSCSDSSSLYSAGSGVFSSILFLYSIVVFLITLLMFLYSIIVYLIALLLFSSLFYCCFPHYSIVVYLIALFCFSTLLLFSSLLYSVSLLYCCFPH